MNKKVAQKQKPTRDVPGTIARWVRTEHLGHLLPDSGPPDDRTVDDIFQRQRSEEDYRADSLSPFQFGDNGLPPSTEEEAP
ncbi:MAG: hypothetical protein Q7S16_00720 [bacterium]|nr:hypothetical protein [bacterium]